MGLLDKAKQQANQLAQKGQEAAKKGQEKLQGAQAKKREVEVGERLGDRLEVAAGLEGGEIVVVAGQRELRDGAPVRFAERPAAPAGELGPAREQVQ